MSLLFFSASSHLSKFAHIIPRDLFGVLHRARFLDAADTNFYVAYDRCYTWSPYGCDDENILEVIPMLWGAKQTGEWESEVAGKYFKHVLMMNECVESSSLPVHSLRK